jgi:monovalent cation:proton antiporter-2 (CPA2) family protein
MLLTLVYLLAGSVIFVSLSRRLGFGSILGYLVAGALIGPSGLRLVTDVDVIHEISEFGVLMLLFLIGLELRPQRIWLMRRTVLGLGGAQVFVTGIVLALATFLSLNVGVNGAIVLGLGLALSSTAIVLPMLGERNLLGTPSGRDAFSVLLFQDLASIPFVAALPLLGDHTGLHGPLWPPILRGVGAVALILFGGRYLVRPLFGMIGRIKTTEVFTATALLTVALAAVVADVANLPKSLGAFAAGVILSESEYRHELQVDIEPFEGLLLGFFFLSIGMAANIGLIATEPVTILCFVIGLLALKIAVGVLLQKLRGQNAIRAVRFALALPQGSEFGFVLFGAALSAKVLDQTILDRVTLVIALSMALSPLLFALSERLIVPPLKARSAPPKPETIDASPAPVVIAGFGRFGQVVGRIMKTRKIAFNALDNDPDNIELVRKFGSKAFYGDPTRIELLRAVGAGEAKILVVALADPAQSVGLVERAKHEFPNLKIYARARNRRHAHLLMNFNVEAVVRETFFSSLRLTELALQGVGLDEEDARRTVKAFRERDEKTLILQHDIYEDERALIQSAQQAARELEELFEEDEDRALEEGDLATNTRSGEMEPSQS